MRTSISMEKDAYWKLKEVKARLRCNTWEEFADKIYDMVFRDEKHNQS